MPEHGTNAPALACTVADAAVRPDAEAFLRLNVTAVDELVTTRLLLSEICAFTYTTSFGSVTIVVWSVVRTIFDAVVPVVIVGGVVEAHKRR